jgi:hypothetical protein
MHPSHRLCSLPNKGVRGSVRVTAAFGSYRRRLVNLNGVLGSGKGTSAKFSSNANTGGTCFGDSGGPILVSGTRCAPGP